MGRGPRPSVDTVELDELRQVLPAYEFGEVLGRGTFAVVIAARHVRLGRDVAVKRLTQAVLMDGESRDRFSTEARLLASLDHPHVVRVHDYVEEGSVCALVMERLHGGSLGERIRTAQVDRMAACAFTAAALYGLEHAHRHGILHRDIKPENLLFGEGDVLKVADFGIAKVLGAQGARMTATAAVIGTPTYMAPEQVSSSVGPLSAATDVWAMGAVLFEMIAGVPPFARRGELTDVLLERIRDDPAPLQTRVPDVPPELAEVVMRALARDPRDRYASAWAYAKALEDAVGTRALAATGVPIHRTEPLSPWGPDATGSATLDVTETGAGVLETLAGTEAGTAAPEPSSRAPVTPAPAPARRGRRIAAAAVALVAVLAVAGALVIA